MLSLGNMELLPIIVIVSLLGFFIMLTLTLFAWQCFRNEKRRKRRQSYGPPQKPPRKLTLQSGKVVPVSEAQDTASTRDIHSFDIKGKPTYTVVCEADPPKPAKSRPLISAHDHGHPAILTDLEAQHPEAICEKPRRVVSEPNRPKEKAPQSRYYSGPAKFTMEKNTSSSVPRPALVKIESGRPSTSKSSERQRHSNAVPKIQEVKVHRPSVKKNQAITDSLQKAYQGPSVLGGEAHEIPPSPQLLENLALMRRQKKIDERQRAEYTVKSSPVSSRVVSDSVQRPAPLFSSVNYNPRVRFAPPTDTDYTHASFLSMTDSASSSIISQQASPLSPPATAIRAPPPSAQASPPVPGHRAHESLSPRSRSPVRQTPPPLRNTPPHLETPDFGHITFFDSATSSEDSSALRRGVSVMSNRSNFTIASSEISSSWTFGSAKVVNIYPSVAQDEEQSTPPYAQTLRSKYGRYPRGRRDKALPGVPPKSPLWQTEFGIR